MRKATIKYYSGCKDSSQTLEITGWIHETIDYNGLSSVVVIEEESTGMMHNIHNPFEMKMLDKPEESGMQALTPEQKEYIELKYAMDKMTKEFRRLQDSGEISHCVPYSVGENTKFIAEALFYEYLERLKYEKKTELQIESIHPHAMLKKYMKHVENEEGITFTDDLSLSKVGFTPEEIVILEKIGQEVYDEN